MIESFEFWLLAQQMQRGIDDTWLYENAYNTYQEDFETSHTFLTKVEIGRPGNDCQTVAALPPGPSYSYPPVPKDALDPWGEIICEPVIPEAAIVDIKPTGPLPDEMTKEQLDALYAMLCHAISNARPEDAERPIIQPWQKNILDALSKEIR